MINVSYLKPPPRELLFKIARNCSSKDIQTNTSSVIKKASYTEFRNEENSRSYLSDSSDSSNSDKGDVSSDNEGSDYDAKRTKPKKTSTVKKQPTSTKASSILALKESQLNEFVSSNSNCTT